MKLWELNFTVMEGLSRGNNLYLDKRGFEIGLSDILDSNVVEYTTLGLQHSVFLKDRAEDLKKELELERIRSVYWRCVAKGKHPIVLGSPEDIEYIMK